MNDTEADLRRLMATATSDMPDGIDLVDGFARLRSRRRRGRAAILAGVAVAAAGATAIALTVASAPAVHTVRPGASARSDGPPRSALAALTTALNKMVNTQSFREVAEVGMQTFFYNGGISPIYRHTCSGEEDAAADLETFSCSGVLDLTELVADGWIYEKLPTVSAGDDYKPWLRIRESYVESPPQPSPIDSAGNDLPQQILAAIEKGVKVTTVGPVSGPGWTGTQYAFSWSKILAKGLKPDVITGVVDVDQQGLARVLEYTDRSTGADGTVLVTTTDETFSDFGVKVTVTLPPASEVYTQNPYYRGNRTGPSR
jgi:hypothetical protein